MFILDKAEFVEEVKAEMAGYEEISEELIEAWVVKFEDYVSKKKNEKLIKKGQDVQIKLDDEAELFKIVDRYLVAIENDEIEAYWQDWKL
jgi:hypothetical protein